MIRVVIVDDQPVVRAGIARILGADDGFEVAAECDDGSDAAATVDDVRPDVVLMDIRMRDVDGIRATREIGALDDPPPVMILTTFDDDDALWGAVEAGAAGFVLKDSPAEALIDATRAVAAGGAWLDPKVAPRALAAFRRTAGVRQHASGLVDQLTEREHDVLRRIARGASNSEIAAAIHVSEATVKSHVGSIFSKLGARDRAAAIVFAYDHGLAHPNES